MTEKPFGVFGRPNLDGRFETVNGMRLSSSDKESRAEVLEEARDRKRIEDRNALRPKDKIGELIRATHFTENKLFPVQFRGSTLSVSRYYPERNAAIDLFEDIHGAEKQEIEFKRDIFKKNGVRYAALSMKSQLASVVEQLGI